MEPTIFQLETQVITWISADYLAVPCNPLSAMKSSAFQLKTWSVWWICDQSPLEHLNLTAKPLMDRIWHQQKLPIRLEDQKSTFSSFHHIHSQFHWHRNCSAQTQSITTIHPIKCTWPHSNWCNSPSFNSALLINDNINPIGTIHLRKYVPIPVNPLEY